MMQLERAGIKWWRKPLAIYDGRRLPAELIVLCESLRPGESGAWLNSTGTKTGVVDLAETSPGKFKTVRVPLPDFVQELLRVFYQHPDVKKGVFDLVLWRASDKNVRFVEVKCPHWDRLTLDQKRFAELAES